MVDTPFSKRNRQPAIADVGNSALQRPRARSRKIVCSSQFFGSTQDDRQSPPAGPFSVPTIRPTTSSTRPYSLAWMAVR